MSEQHPQILSPRQLLLACVMAAGVALTVLVTIILPAEYQLDPTGFGRFSGLLSLSTPAQPPAPAPSAGTDELRSDRIKLQIPAGQGLEYKLLLEQGQRVRYSWKSRDGELHYDLHGEPQGDTSGYFESYAISTADQVRGAFSAPFSGSHGWYWENRSPQPISITLIIEGAYQIIGIK